MSLRLFVLRHGETVFTRERRFAGWRDVPLTDAVSSYLFNSQLVTIADGSIALIAPVEARDNDNARRAIERVIAEDNPVKAAHYVDVRESMRNGGGPAPGLIRPTPLPQPAAEIAGGRGQQAGHDRSARMGWTGGCAGPDAQPLAADGALRLLALLSFLRDDVAWILGVPDRSIDARDRVALPAVDSGERAFLGTETGARGHSTFFRHDGYNASGPHGRVGR